ncbi:MAG: sigma-70 family RNA polymerase sigma factor [Pseudolabrys sp.]|nr:sigma-70 family RNA polymerase sigma factor [Pseudolabrys sp.]
MTDGKGEVLDEELVRRFRQLALPHLDDVYTLARYLMSNAADADDAVQECYLRAFRHFGGYRGPAIKPWLFAILRNVCYAAHSKNSGLVFTDATSTGSDDAVPVWREAEETPEGAAVRRHDAGTMRRMIQDLPPEFREVIVLREIEDLPYRDIANVVGVPIGTVMSRLARGRAMLRRAWTAAEAKDDGR